MRLKSFRVLGSYFEYHETCQRQGRGAATQKCDGRVASVLQVVMYIYVATRLKEYLVWVLRTSASESLALEVQTQVMHTKKLRN